MPPYRFITERRDYSDYASGHVFYGLPGHPAFPIRLMREIFQRCLAHRAAQGAAGPCVLYDPCCGAAYHLSTLAYFHWHAIAALIASDVDAQVLDVAERNLALLTIEGLERRRAEIAEMLARYQKASHAAALESAARLRRRLLELRAEHAVDTRMFAADVMDGRALRENLAGQPVDVVIADIPYGQRSSWVLTEPPPSSPLDPVRQMLESLRPILASPSVVAIASDKRQRIAHERYRRLERFQVGKRRVTLLQPAPP